MANYKTFEKRKIALEQAVRYSGNAGNACLPHHVVQIAETFLNFLVPEASNTDGSPTDGDAT